MNACNNSPAHPRPITTATKHNTMSPVGTAPSSFSSSSSSLTSPTGPCPLSIPKHIMDGHSKPRSTSDPPEHFPEDSKVHRERMRRQSEQAGTPTSPLSVHGIQKARLSGYIPENHDLQRPLSSQDAYDNLPSPKKVSQAVSTPELGRVIEFDNEKDNYDDVPVPRPCDPAADLSSPRQNSGLHLATDFYAAVPPPRPVSQASNRSSQDIYDLVPPPRPMSSYSQDGHGFYDVPPNGRNSETYDTVPSVQRPVAYGVLPTGRVVGEENYDIVPPVSRPVAPKPNHIQPGNPQENYDVVPKRYPAYDFPSGTPSDQENYDFVPPARPVARKPNQFQQGESHELYDVVPRRETPHKVHNGQSAYDNLPSERTSPQENYDVFPLIHRPVPSKSSQSQACNSQENYDIVPIPRPASENYDVVPPPRATTTENQPWNSDVQPHSNGYDHRLSDIYSVPPKQSEVHEWVSAPPRPAPYQPSKDAYDSLPNTNRPVSADSGLNASFTSICSLKGEGDDGQGDRYDAPLPALPNTRDSGSLSDSSPDDDMNPKEIYDRPPTWETGDSIYDIPPKQEGVYDVVPKHSDGIYDKPPMASDDIYDVPPSRKTVPMVDRTTKRPPQVNRANKPRTPTAQDHNYCNMAPPVDRESKYKRSTMPQPEPSYVNFGVSPQRPQNLPLMKTLTKNAFVGSLPNQPSRWSGGLLEDPDYYPMQAPTRSEMTRCYSYSKEDCTRSRSQDNDQCYEDMSALQTRRDSCGKSNSSSSSSLADNDDLYMPMVPQQMQEQRSRRDLLYAEVEIVEGAQHARIPTKVPPRRENTNYTFINEESTRALLETCHARQGHR